MISIRALAGLLIIQPAISALYGQAALELKLKDPAAGSWDVHMTVRAGMAFELQSSPDLKAWSPLERGLMGTGFQQRISLAGMSAPAGFLRLVRTSDSGEHVLDARVPETGENDAARRLYISTGQSLAIGGEGIPVLSSVQRYGNMTFAGGPRATSTQWAAAGPLVETDGTAPAVDWWNAANRGETPCSGACNGWMYLAQKWDRPDPSAAGYHWFAFSSGRGGRKLTDLMPGSAPYQDLYLPMLAASKSLADAALIRSAVYVIAFRQGESDSTNKVSGAQYRSNLAAFRAAAVSDAVASTGQAFKPLFLCWQPQVATITHPDIALAMWEACRASDDMVLAGPEYYFASKTGLHFTAEGYRTAGRYDAKISWLWFHGKKRWRPLEPTACAISGEQVDIRYRVPVPPLRMDITSLGDITQKGFHVTDSRSAVSPVTISSVSIQGPDSIRLICSRPIDPATYHVRYGLDYNRPAFPLSPLQNSGAGCVRDSDDFEIEGEALPNWSVQFSINSSTF